MSRPWELSRRTLLRGLGATVALPLLEQMMPGGRAHAAAAPVKRLVVIFVPCGMQMEAFTPATDGAGYALTPLLKPLAALKDEFTVITGLHNRPAYVDGSAPHVGSTASVLTTRKVLAKQVSNGISMDQLAARELGGHTRFPSLELGLDGGIAGTCEEDFSCAYLCNISWASETLAMSKEINPVAAFDRLFGRGGIRARDPALRRKHHASVLDAVREDARRLQARLGAADQQRLDEYLTGLRALEQRLQQPAPVCASGAPPPPPRDMRDHTSAMLDLMKVALRCDLTRIITFMMGNGASARQFPFLGITGQHHAISHHKNVPAQIEANLKIQKWEITQLASFLQALKDAPEPGGGSVLDSSLVLFTSEMGDGNRHDRMNMPVILAGRAGGKLAQGRHLRLATPQPLANLYVSMLQLLGVPVETFGDEGTGPLPGL